MLFIRIDVSLLFDNGIRFLWILACVWEQRKLGELITEYKETVDAECTLPVLTSSKTEGVILQEEHFGSRQNHDITGYNILPKNYCTYRNRSDGVDFTFNINKCCEKGIISKFYPVFCGNNSDIFFISLVLNYSDEVVKEIAYTCTGTGQKVLSFLDLQKMNIRVPSYQEQKKIAEMFSSIDTLITLHQRNLIMDLGFDSYDWEQRKLGEVFRERTERANGDEELLSVTIGSGVIRQADSDKRNIASEDKSNYKVVRKGDVPYNSMRMWQGAVGISEYDGIVSPAYTVLEPINNTNGKFFMELFKKETSLQIFQRWSQGLTSDTWNLKYPALSTIEFYVPSVEEQEQIADYFQQMDNLITLHQRKYNKKTIFAKNVWEQRKLGDVFEEYAEKNHPELPALTIIQGGGTVRRDESDRNIMYDKASLSGYKMVRKDDFILHLRSFEGGLEKATCDGVISPAYHTFHGIEADARFYYAYFRSYDFIKIKLVPHIYGIRDGKSIDVEGMKSIEIPHPSYAEQKRIGDYLEGIDTLITLHQRRYFILIKVIVYDDVQRKSERLLIYIQIIIEKEAMAMPELEAVIEQKLIEQLVYGDSQWTYREDLKTEEDLWRNFKYILEQNNKERLNGENLSDAEFEQVKNQLQFSSFYKAGEWLVGENGKVQVHVQRDTERLHLVVMNHEHIAGGSSVYEVINQYQALATDENTKAPARDRRFDVTLMINGLPMIHIELKNKQHSYMDGFWQIKKYIWEGKFTGIFSAVQMFVISNGVNTKYFSAASDTELNPKFISGWLDADNNPVADYLDFAKSVLRIPQAHEMIARYTVLDEDAKKLIILRPYQIHAIESIREASKHGKSGYVWHTTGSGKTLTSYKATRNLLMDIPAIDKAIFLIDRKDLDTQTTMAFQAYANNDLIDVDETDNVIDLKNKLKSDDRQVIVTTIQKLQRLITKRLAPGTPEYNKIKNLKIAYVVDECHRAVTPATKRELERFFGNSLWFGFTGTPRFAENPYPQMGDLPRTTEELYGERLHKYTIQNAIHDNAVLGFQVEHLGPKTIEDETDSNAYDNETHMLKVLDVILNKSYHKLGFQNGKGKTYEGLLTTSSIQTAQKYYELLSRVKRGETSLVIDEKIKQVLPDFPKFAITYSVSENEEGSQVNHQKMQESLDDYNEMFGTKYDIAQIQGYNGNLNKRLARKDAKFKSRQEQLDLVIVVDRLLTGFDAPCMSTIFIDRQPMGPHDLIQAFSRTNRIYDKNKTNGQIVSFQAPELFKRCVDDAVKLYSAGSSELVKGNEWEEIEQAFRKALAALRVCAETPSEIPGMSLEEKKVFAKIFQNFDKLFAQLKSFTKYEDEMLKEYGITEEEYYDYAGHYLNVLEEIKPEPDSEPDSNPTPGPDPDYELMAYSNTKIDYEYIINLIQNIVAPTDDGEVITPEERQKKLDEVKQYVEELRKNNPKVAEIMAGLIYEIELDENKYKGQSILNIVENMKYDCIDKVITDFCIVWYASKEDVMYAATHYRNGIIPNESAIKATIDYTSYKETQEKALPKFKYYAQMMADLRKTLDEEIQPLMSN